MESTQWFYLKKGQQRGPVDTGDLTSLIHSGVLPPDTLVFTSTQADWIPANTTGVFPLKAATLTAGNNTFKRRAIGAVILLLLMLGGGLLVMQHTLNEDDRVRGKYQFDAAQPSPRKKAAEQNDSGNPQSNGRLDSGNLGPVADDVTLQNKLADLQRQIAAGKKRESRNDNQLAEVNIARLQLEQSLDDSRNQVADLSRQIIKLDNQSQFGNMTDDGLAASRERRFQLEQRLAAVSRSNADLLQRVKEIKANDQQDSQNNAGLTAQLRIASKELKTAQQIISSLQQQLKDANPPASNIPKERTHAVGDIKYVNARQKFIGINGGSDNGVKNGDVFLIISLSTGEFLGRITITKTGPSFAGGTLNNQGISRLRKGDLLFR
jgi:hypothetical protein